jgi:acetolactate synthase small subunit
MTIVVESDEAGATRLDANLYNIFNVLRVDNVTSVPAVVGAGLPAYGILEMARTGRIAVASSSNGGSVANGAAG